LLTRLLQERKTCLQFFCAKSIICEIRHIRDENKAIIILPSASIIIFSKFSQTTFSDIVKPSLQEFVLSTKAATTHCDQISAILE